jgi:hypothetical protein
MTYLIDFDYKNYYSLLPDLSDLAIKMPSYSQRFRAKPRLAGWVAPIASFFASENYEGQGEQLPDISSWALGNLVLSPKAYNAFKDILAPSGEFLPLLIGDETYYMHNTLFVIPEEGIDRSNAVDVVNSGVHMGQNNVQFDEATLDGRSIFKSPTNKLTFSYATNVFKDIYTENDFSGLTFEEIHLK